MPKEQYFIISDSDLEAIQLKLPKKSEAYQLTTQLDFAQDMPDRIIKDLKKLVEYTYSDEQRHFLEEPSKDHIFQSINRLDKWVESL